MKAADGVHHVGPGDDWPDPARLRAWLVHEDGMMRVPVLVDGARLVRGFTEHLYGRALAFRGPDPRGAA